MHVRNLFSKTFTLNRIDVILYGFLNGFYLLLSGNTLNFWLAVEKIDLKVVSLFSLVTLPYSIKFLLSPLIEKFQIYFLHKYYNQQKSWIIFSLLALSATLFMLSNTNPANNLFLTCILGFFIALFSTLLDIALNVERIKNSSSEQKENYGSPEYILGYRFGMLLSGAGAILASTYISWQNIYLSSAILSLFFCIFFIHSRKIIYQKLDTDSKKTHLNYFTKNFLEPFKHFKTLPNFLYILFFLTIYKASDNIILVMLNPLLLKLGYEASEIAFAGKIFGLCAYILGVFAAGYLSKKITILKQLLYFGLIHALTHMSYFILLACGHNAIILYFVAGIEAFTSALTMTAYISFMSSLCKGENLGAQYALLFSTMGISRSIFPVFSGFIVAYTNWYGFFTVSIIIALIPLTMIKKLK